VSARAALCNSVLGYPPPYWVLLASLGGRLAHCGRPVYPLSFTVRSLSSGARAMPKGEERKLAALAKKNAAKAAKVKPNKRRQYDDTLPPEREEDVELRDFFSEMKKREF